jgi:hypothetical protein
MRTGQLNFWVLSTSMDAILTLMDGRFEDVLDVTKQIRSRGNEAGIPAFANIQAVISDIRARVYLGRSLEAIERGLRADTGPSHRLGNPLPCLVLAHLGRKDETSEILDKWVVSRPGIGTSEDETAIYMDSIYIEAAVLTDHKKVAELLLTRFTGSGVCTPGIFYPTCSPRHMGGAAALLGRHEEAREHYKEAIRICTEMRFRPELALSRLQLAELLLKHYPKERTDAIAHLDFSIAEFRDMKMQPSLERALRHKEILKA